MTECNHDFSRTCICSIMAMEPDEDCPIHGHPWPPRCADCGKFLPYPRIEAGYEHTQEAKL